MPTRILIAALALALAACDASDLNPYRKRAAAPAPTPPANADEAAAADRNKLCARDAYVECMEYVAFGWRTYPNHHNRYFNDGKHLGAWTSLNPHSDLWSLSTTAVSGTYSGKAFGYFLGDRDRLRRVNGTVTMEYRNYDAERPRRQKMDISFRFPGYEFYNQDFNSVSEKFDCHGDGSNHHCFTAEADSEVDSGIVGAQFRGSFYGPESQEFSGWFWKRGFDFYGRVRGTDLTLNAAFGVARQ